MQKIVKCCAKLIIEQKEIDNMKRILPFISTLSLGISILSIWISLDVKNTNERFFLAEKRPYLNVDVVKLNGKYLNITDEDPTSFSLEIKNEGDLTAKNIKTNLYLIKNEVFYPTHNISLNRYKISPDGHELMNPILSNDQLEKNLQNGKLSFLIEIKYKSDADENIEYATRKKFTISETETSLIGGLGEFE